LANLPTGLYILLALISLFFKLETNYLSIHWTNFYHFFNQMIGIGVNVNDPNFFLLFLKECCHGNQFYGKIWVYAFIRQISV